MNILQAIHDENLFRTYVSGATDGDLTTWQNWLSFLRVLYGLPTTEAEHGIIRQSTGRDPSQLSSDGYAECLLLAGRRSGKSKTIALVGAAEAVLSGREKKVSAGEIPMVPILSPTKNQSRIIHSYLKGVFDSTPILQNEVVEEDRESFTLRNGVEIRIIAGDPRKIRGFTLIAAIVDEVAMFGFSEEAKVNDTELVRAIRPALASTGGPLLCVGTPYAARGYSYQTYKRHYGNDTTTLVWNAASLTMNPTLSKSIVQNAIDEDPIAANVEYATSPGLFREDVDDFVSRAVVESLVVRGRLELPPLPNINYAAFADVSGGRHDDAALAIGHKEGRIIILDCLERYKSPHNPYEVVGRMCDTIRRYGCHTCTGDAYAAEWSKTAFKNNGIEYGRSSRSDWKTGASALRKVAKPKSELYASLLPRLHSGEVELLDDDILVSQVASLQRRTRSGGRDSIDHPPGGHDDLANCLAGVVNVAAERVVFAGFIGDRSDPSDDRPKWLQRAESELRLLEYEHEQLGPEDPMEAFNAALYRSSYGARGKLPF